MSNVEILNNSINMNMSKHNFIGWVCSYSFDFVRVELGTELEELSQSIRFVLFVLTTLVSL
jgi:hypothetical protein